MKITSRFTIAVHTLLVIHSFQDSVKVTSALIASSVNANPVVIRRILLQLKAAGLVSVASGTGGAKLIRDPKDITLYDVYEAVDCVEGDLFHFHENPNPQCPVGRNVHTVLDQHLQEAQDAMEGVLKKTTLADLTAEMQPLL